ncbi:MAG: ATP-dependent DNA helicase RecG [bacterium]|nr:ATP-dependent DNA helicase RecG [bacterium]
MSSLPHISNVNPLDTSVQYVKGVGPKRAELLARIGVVTIRDLLFYFPRDYQDRRNITPIAQLEPGSFATVMGTITAVQESKPVKRGTRVRHILKITISDQSGLMDLVWFNQPYRKDQFTIGEHYIFSGKVSTQTLMKEMVNPEYEKLDSISPIPTATNSAQFIHTHRIVPIYPLSEQIDQRWLRTILKTAIEQYAPRIPEILPKKLLLRYQWLSRAEAIREIHFPSSMEKVMLAKQRLIYDELFLLQLLLAGQKAQLQRITKPQKYSAANLVLYERFISQLPFVLTSAQQRVIREIQADLLRPAPMNRLLQGDVGSGKTVVALSAMLIALGSGYQSALMAPTEILAQQHYATIKTLLAKSNFDLDVILLIGGMTPRQKKDALARIQSCPNSIIIGTHALIQEQVKFSRLALVIIDEQHRFGVIQRHILRKKGWLPDVLVMTATPIPRTLAMTVYSDLDVSVIDELPPERLPVQTRWLTEEQRDELYAFLKQELGAGNQAYLIYPLIEESDKLALRAATKMYEHLQRDIFPEFRLGLLHGRMKESDKQQMLANFLSQKIQMLVSTTVVEVGVDVTNATIMVIEHAERFGLAQLHQLRGRVGRGNRQSTCILVTAKNISDAAQARMQILCSTTDGFLIAEEDLKWRGSGELLGTAQHGTPSLHLADLLRDVRLLQQAKNDAVELIARDALLSMPEHAYLRQEILRMKRSGKTDLSKVA